MLKASNIGADTVDPSPSVKMALPLSSREIPVMSDVCFPSAFTGFPDASVNRRPLRIQ